jgi:hypothetical protein
MISVTLDDRLLQAQLKALPEKMQVKVLKPAVNKALGPVRTAARANLRKSIRQSAKRWGKKRANTGELSRSIAVKTFRVKSASTVVGMVGARTTSVKGKQPKGGAYSGGNYAHLVEAGHRMVTGGTAKRERYRYQYLRSDGSIQVKTVSDTKSKKAGKTGTGKVSFRKVPPYPFLGPAFLQATGRIGSILVSEINSRLARLK